MIYKTITKPIVIFIFFIFILILISSCEYKGSGTFVKAASIAESKNSFVLAPDIVLTEADKLPPSIEKHEKLFTDENYLYYIENSARLKRIGLKSRKIEDMFKITSCVYRSSKYSRLNDSRYVFSANFITNNTDDNAIVLYDMENKKENILYHWSHVSPVSQAATINYPNEVSILYLKDRGDEITYNIDIIDIPTQTAKTIISKTYNYVSDFGERPIEKLLVENGNFIVLSEKKEKNRESIFSIDEYDLKGTLLSSTEIDLGRFLDLNEYFGHGFKDFISNFYKSGNFFVLITQHQRVAIFEKNKNSIRFVQMPEDFMIPLNLAGSRQAALDMGYLFFATEDGAELLTIDVNKRLFYKQKIVHRIPSNDAAIMGVDTTRKGDLLILITDFSGNTQDYTFYLPFEKIRGIITEP